MHVSSFNVNCLWRVCVCSLANNLLSVACITVFAEDAVLILKGRLQSFPKSFRSTDFYKVVLKEENSLSRGVVVDDYVTLTCNISKVDVVCWFA